MTGTAQKERDNGKAAEAVALYHANKALAAYRTGQRLERDKKWDEAAPYFDKYNHHIQIADGVRQRNAGE